MEPVEHQNQSLIEATTKQMENGIDNGFNHFNDLTLCVKYPSDKNLRPAPLSCDPESLELRRQLSNVERISMSDALKGNHSRPVRVYIDGVFDLFHFGHAQCLSQAKTYFPGPVRLIAGVSAEEECRKHKRNPIMTVEERVACVRHCRYVDEVIINAPWFTSPDFVEEHKIDFVCHDAIPYSCGPAVEDLYAWLKKKDMFFATERTPNISTTDLINRLLAHKEKS